MPLLSIEVSRPLEPPAVEALLKAASSQVAELLHKPEHYLMVRYQYNPDMRLGGDNAPLALIELRSIGLPEEAPRTLSLALCTLIEHHTGIPGSRIYLICSDVPRTYWGHDGTTF